MVMNMQRKANLTLFCDRRQFSEEMKEQFEEQGIVVTSVFGFIFVPAEKSKIANEIFYGKVEA
jgi:hypothetical protein